MTWAILVLCGAGLLSSSTQFFEQPGLSPAHASDLIIGQYGLGAVAVFASWFLLIRIGRQTLYLIGLIALFLLCLIVGFLTIPGPNDEGAVWHSGSTFVAATFFYNVTIDPICYGIVAEIPSDRLRRKTVVLARIAFNIVSIINGALTPLMINLTGWA